MIFFKFLGDLYKKTLINLITLNKSYLNYSFNYIIYIILQSKKNKK